MTAGDTARPAGAGSARSRWVRRLVLLAFALACAWGIIDLVGRIYWDEVWEGIGHLAAWQLLVLVVVVGVRQILNARPLALFVGDLPLFRATAVDQGSTLISMVGPPTSDALLRIAVLRSWGVETPRVLAGSTMNMMAFYLARWLAPAVGFTMLLTARFDGTYALVAAACLPVAGGILAATILLTRAHSPSAPVAGQESWCTASVGPWSPTRGRCRPGSSRATSRADFAEAWLRRCRPCC